MQTRTGELPDTRLSLFRGVVVDSLDAELKLLSVVLFVGWREREDAVVHWRGPGTYDPLVVYFPKTWLLNEGWKKSGTISFYEVPSVQRK